VMYAPQLEPVGKQLFCQRVERDEKFIGELEAALMSFADTVNENEQILRAKAA